MTNAVGLNAHRARKHEEELSRLLKTFPVRSKGRRRLLRMLREARAIRERYERLEEDE